MNYNYTFIILLLLLLDGITSKNISAQNLGVESNAIQKLEIPILKKATTK